MEKALKEILEAIEKNGLRELSKNVKDLLAKSVADEGKKRKLELFKPTLAQSTVEEQKEMNDMKAEVMARKVPKPVKPLKPAK
jgi:hypothetical protein